MKIVTNKARIWSTETITIDGGDIITIVGIEDSDDEMTDKEIIKAARYCNNGGFCSLRYPFYEWSSGKMGIVSCLAEFCKFIIEKSKQPDENICDNPTTITQEAAIDRLHELGWLQKHDKELTETNIRIGYDAAIMERANVAEVIEQVCREHKRNTKNESDYDNSKENDEAIPEWASGLYDKLMESN